MKRLIVATACAASLGCVLAAPAMAQPYGGTPPASPGEFRGPGDFRGPDDFRGPGGGGGGLREREDRLDERIRRGIADGSLNRAEADRAMGEMRAIRNMEADLRARSGGRLYGPDRERIQARFDQLERSIRWMRNNGPGQGYGPGPGAGPGYGGGGGFWAGAPTSLEQRLDWLEARIRRGVGDGSITRGEAFRAQGMVRDFRRTMADLVARDHGRLTPVDRQYLMGRLDNLSQQIRWLRNNGIDRR